MLRRLLTLSGVERRALRQATLRVVAVRFWLTFRPIADVLTRARHQSERPLRSDPASVETLVWAVKAAGRRLLRKNPCLTEALALWGLLRRHGYESQIRIGVARDRTGDTKLEAHAWVERNGEVLIGGAESPTNYVPLPAFDVP